METAGHSFRNTRNEAPILTNVRRMEFSVYMGFQLWDCHFIMKVVRGTLVRDIGVELQPIAGVELRMEMCTGSTSKQL